MVWITKITAGFLALASGITIPLAFLAANLGHIVFNPQTATSIVEAAIQRTDLAGHALVWMINLRPDGASEFETTPWRASMQPLGMDLKPGDWSQLLKIMLPDEVVREWASTAVQLFTRWLDGAVSPNPPFHMELVAWKNHLRGMAGDQAAFWFLQSLPPCPDRQVAKIRTRGSATEPAEKLPVVNCRLPGPWTDLQNQQYLESFQVGVNAIPDRVILEFDLNRLSGVELQTLAGLQSGLRWIRLGSQLAWIIPATFLTLLLAFKIRSWVDLSRWWGLTILCGGLGALICLLIVPVQAYWLPFFIRSPQFSFELKQELGLTLRLAIETMTPAMLGQSLLLIWAGLALFWSGLIRRPAVDSPERWAVEA